ncbi:Metallo-dependent phosphatase [Didymella exigua CBS 183.55]|uniref:Metallo-dependent phosphatase n=1 Tax=Didymella exigua CBS 183.55 TaxID=1150837 RepID=A0A6A5REC0_9PLEO|nr:Metallo-dependent phosphatase [Didymella exigua CBS 183.55]KAF1925454.1 Metallo-dependent phosphatase [Didymella exigua CBS 183.55]
MSSTTATTTSHTAKSHIKTRFLIISDTHSSDPKQNDRNDAPFRSPLPKADVLLHCGDLTMIGLIDEYERTLDMLGSIDADLKLVIAGNHDISLDETYYKRKGANMQGIRYNEDMPRQARELWTGARAKKAGVTYLEEGTHSFALKNGARLGVYASPYQPEFCDYAFPYQRNEDRYNLSHQCSPGATPIAENPVPDWQQFEGIDVVMTHGPPMGVLDVVRNGEHVGCEHLLRAMRRCKPMLHCFGHIHEGWGAQKVQWKDGDELDVRKPMDHIKDTTSVEVDDQRMRDERAVHVDISTGGDDAVVFGHETLMVNASIMNLAYYPVQGPWLVDMDLERASDP